MLVSPWKVLWVRDMHDPWSEHRLVQTNWLVLNHWFWEVKATNRSSCSVRSPGGTWWPGRRGPWPTARVSTGRSHPRTQSRNSARWQNWLWCALGMKRAACQKIHAPENLTGFRRFWGLHGKHKCNLSCSGRTLGPWNVRQLLSELICNTSLGLYHLKPRLRHSKAFEKLVLWKCYLLLLSLQAGRGGSEWAGKFNTPARPNYENLVREGLTSTGSAPTLTSPISWSDFLCLLKKEYFLDLSGLSKIVCVCPGRTDEIRQICLVHLTLFWGVGWGLKLVMLLVRLCLLRGFLIEPCIPINICNGITSSDFLQAHTSCTMSVGRITIAIVRIAFTLTRIATPSQNEQICEWSEQLHGLKEANNKK